MKPKIVTFLLCIMMSLTMQSQHKVGLVLSGGGALGFAHIGAIQALEEAGFQPTIVAGTSMGALIGVLYAHGLSPDEIMQTVKDEKLYRNSKLLKLNMSKEPGIYNLHDIKKLLKEMIPSNSFDSLQKEFYICAMNLTEATPKYVGTGNQLAEFVIASASIPTIFEAQLIDDVQYTDGGMLNNFPAQPIRPKCDFLIGIDVLPLTHKKAEKNFESMLYGLRGVQHVNSLPGHDLCDFLVEIHAIDTYNEFDFKHYREIYEIGYETTKKALEENGFDKK